MKSERKLERAQRATVISALLLFILILFLLQLWLFVSSLEKALSGNPDIGVAAAITSVVVLFVNVWMLKGVFTLSRED